MSVSLEYLQRCASGTGFQLSTLETIVRLGELAGDVGRHPLLGRSLALKGGSALNLCFGMPGRLSVDLDFNYVGRPEREAMLADRPRIEEAVTDLARRRGYAVQRSADAFAGRKLFLGYASVLGTPERIELDLNFLFRVPIGSPTELRLWQPEGLEQPRLRVVSMHELCIGKMLALLERTAPRDAWDVARLPQLASDTLASREFRARFVALSATLDHPLTTYGASSLTKRLSMRAIREQLLPMLASGERPTASELIDAAWQVVQPLLRLDRGEQQAVEAVQRGEFLGGLLGVEDAEELATLANHPAILWKLYNARKHLGVEVEARPWAKPDGSSDDA